MAQRENSSTQPKKKNKKRFPLWILIVLILLASAAGIVYLYYISNGAILDKFKLSQKNEPVSPLTPSPRYTTETDSSVGGK
jgi:flagellar basal body-associated protein FliL